MVELARIMSERVQNGKASLMQDCGTVLEITTFSRVHHKFTDDVRVWMKWKVSLARWIVSMDFCIVARLGPGDLSLSWLSFWSDKIKILILDILHWECPQSPLQTGSLFAMCHDIRILEEILQNGVKMVSKWVWEPWGRAQDSYKLPHGAEYTPIYSLTTIFAWSINLSRQVESQEYMAVFIQGKSTLGDYKLLKPDGFYIYIYIYHATLTHSNKSASFENSTI